MKIYTSYFYKIRFFNHNIIPLSTAMWDPKWYHNCHGQDHVFIDKNGVVNGLRINPLVPGKSCSNLCRGIERCDAKDPHVCKFLKEYRRQLDALDFNTFIVQLEQHIDTVADKFSIESPIVALIVYESPNKDCSERGTLHEWFRDNGMPIQELE